MLRKTHVFAALSAVMLGSAPAVAALTTGAFVARANTLRSQGFAALLSPDFQVLKEEARVARQQLKAESDARVKAGKRPIADWTHGAWVRITQRSTSNRSPSDLAALLVQ